MQNNSDNSFSNNKMPRFGISNTMHDVAAIDPYQIAKQQRVMPRELKAGAQRGEMVVFGKLSVRNPDSNEIIIIGTNNDEFGIFGAIIANNDDTNQSITWKIIGATRYIYKDNANIIQDGVLPDGSGGFIIVKDGYEVADVYS